MGINTGFTKSNGSGGTEDIGANLVEKSYLMDRYPELAGTFKQAGLWLWGRNGEGQLGTNNMLLMSSPVQTVAGGTNWKQVDVGYQHTAAIKTDGTLWLWGDNNYGQLGTNNVTRRSSPVQTVSAGTNWKQVSCGSNQTAAIKTDGTLWLWGGNIYGQLGTNNVTGRSSPVQTVAGGTNWKQVSCGSSHIAAIKTDGTMWGWGKNTVGTLGDNSIVHRSSPVQTVAGGTNWKQVSCGYLAASAIKTDGTLWSWGFNSQGQLGDSTINYRSSPVQTIAGGNNWKQVKGGYLQTAAIKTDGTLWTWGYNGNGQLGDNTIVDKSSPVQTVSGGTNWKQVSCGYLFAAAIKTDGGLWLWGDNNYGQLGTNNVTGRSSPVQTVSAGTNWKQVSCFGSIFSPHIAAIRDDSSDPI